jgi:TRAP-type C4-dicarboxylate transport system permease small subunit
MPSAQQLQSPRWYSIPPRVLLFTLFLTLLSFAVSLLLSILGLVIAARLHAATPDLRFAYRNVALPVAVVAGSVALVLSLVMEIRHYRQSKALAEIARASR